MKKPSTYMSEMFQKLFDNQTIGILLTNKSQNNLVLNKKLASLFGYTQEALLNQSTDIFHLSNHTLKHFKYKIIRAVQQGKPIDLDYRFKHKNGSILWGHVTGELLQKEQNILWTITDITQRVALQKELQRNQQQLSAINGLINLGTWELDLRSKKLTTSIEMNHIIGIKVGQEFRYIDIIKMVHPDDKEILKKGLKRLLNATISSESTTLRLLRKDKIRHLFLQGKVIYDTESRPISIIGATLDITDKKGLELKLQKQNDFATYQSSHDPLTGLPNRLLLEDRLKQIIASSKREHRKIAILFIDMDDFKALNDALGHAFGDKYLIEVAKRMQKRIRANDTLARLSGDIFVIVLDNIKDISVITTIIDKELTQINKMLTIDSKHIYPRMSIGVAVYPHDGKDCDTLLKNADAAMHKAKANGGHTYSFYDHSLTQKALERISIEESLKNAISNSELVVYYQPQINAENNTFVGMEALVRWQHPTKGLVMPGNFIPAAESLNIIIDLNNWVIEHAIIQHVKWYTEGRRPGVLALNLAVKQLEDEQGVKTIKSLLKKHGCRPEWIALEVTEGQLMQKPQVAITMLKELSDLGIEIAVDDFGTGYSSLSYLKHLPIDKLKIDKSFVDNLPHNLDDIAITKTVIMLAKNLNLKVIAEGVETEEQCNFLLKHGCKHIQGYLYSKPISSEVMETFMLKYKC